MKKLIALLLALAACLSICLTASAYQLYFSITNIKCYVNDPKGAEMIAEDHSDGAVHDIPKYQKITVMPSQELTLQREFVDPEMLTLNGFDTKGKYYGYVEYMGSNGSEVRGYIELNKLKSKQDSVAKTKGVKLDYPDYYHLMQGSLDMYSGPSQCFKKVGTIPKGADIKVTYVNYQGIYSYGYTEYNGVGGWVFTYPYTGYNALAEIVDENSYFSGEITVFNKDVALYDLFTNDKDGNYTVLEEEIPIGTKLKYKYYLDMKTCLAAYTEYNGKKGYVYFGEYLACNSTITSNCVTGLIDIGYITKQSPLYSKAGDINSATGALVQSFSRVEVSGFVIKSDEKGENPEYWVNIKYKDSEGWVIANEENNVAICGGTYMEMRCTEGTIPVFKDPSLSSEQVHTIATNQTFQFYMPIYKEEGTWYYCVIDGEAGWVPESTNYESLYQSISFALSYNDDGTVKSSVVIKGNSTVDEETTEITSAIDESTITQGEATTQEPESAKIRGQYGRLIVKIFVAVIALAVVAVVAVAVIIKKRDKNSKGKYKRID